MNAQADSVVGVIKLKDSGFSFACGEDDALEIIAAISPLVCRSSSRSIISTTLKSTLIFSQYGSGRGTSMVLAAPP